MTTLFLGIDVSKGYADMVCMERSGGIISGGGRFDDTPKGHQTVSAWVTRTLTSRNDSTMIVGLESSGGLERNWMRMFKQLSADSPILVYLLNPLAVKRFLERDLHRNVTDALSAKGIARYLRQGMRPQEVPYEPNLEGPQVLYRHINSIIKQSGKVKNELQSLLPRVQPGLVRFCRNGIPAWLLTILTKYPTAPKLARAKAETVARIPYVTLKRARILISDAKESVAAQRDEYTAVVIRSLATELIHMNELTKRLKKDLCRSLPEDEGVKIMKSIIGIGQWTAVCLRLELGPIERFPNAKSMVAFSGLDPRVLQSGDSERHIGISRRGRSQIRAVLFYPTLAAIRSNPIIRSFYNKLRAKGKPKKVCIVACMRKMLHIVYGCWISNKPFDPNYVAIGPRKQASPDIAATNHQQPDSSTPALSLDAPISRREAVKRKAAAMPQTHITRRTRGLDSASQTNSTTLISGEAT